jgi:hypothetical protein
MMKAKRGDILHFEIDAPRPDADAMPKKGVRKDVAARGERLPLAIVFRHSGNEGIGFLNGRV